MKRNTYELSRLIRYATTATADQLMTDYGVEVLDDGKVYDSIEDHTFQTITEWAEDVVGFDLEDDKRNRFMYDDEIF